MTDTRKMESGATELERKVQSAAVESGTAKPWHFA